MSACTKCEGWGCRQCRPSTYSETDAPGVEAHELDALRAEVEAAWEALGLAWRREGVSLAEAILAKCDTLEGVRP